MKQQHKTRIRIVSSHAGRIVLAYIVVAALWILFSDAAVRWWAGNAELLSRIQSYKGLFFVAITAALLFVLIRRAEGALRAEKAFTDTALDVQKDTFLVFEPQTGKMVRWNRALVEVSGYTDEEIATMRVPGDWCTGQDIAKAAAAIEKVLSEGVATVEISLVTKDGRKIPVEFRGSALRDPEGQPQYVIALGRDITERKHAEEALKIK
ncbi:MAG: PAS domain S-box protein [Phycisphaerales bacterium]|nr:MAG: PAS domain S-box protein [Phycisphaerales bacterium]